MIGLAGPGLQRSIATITGPHDAGPARLGQTLGDQIIHARSDIVLHLAPPLPITGRSEGPPHPRRSPEIGLEYLIAARCQELGPGIIGQIIPGLGTAVRHDHQRQDRVGSRARRTGQIAEQGLAVGCRIVDPCHGPQGGFRQSRINGIDIFHPPLVDVEDIELAGIVWSRGPNQPARAVPGLGDD